MSTWIPGNLKPKKPGVYQRNYNDGIDRYSWWDGKYWSEGYANIEDAKRIKNTSGFPEIPWRNPNASDKRLLLCDA